MYGNGYIKVIGLQKKFEFSKTIYKKLSWFIYLSYKINILKPYMPLKINQPAPDFTLASSSRRMFTLSKDMFNKPCILYFYPKDFTPGCTKEACEFRDTFAIFRDLHISVIGISSDDINTHLEFKKQYNLPFDLLADTLGEVANLYEVSMPLIKFTRRTTYLLDKKHRIAAVYTNLFAAEKHIQAMIDQVKSGVLNENIII